MTDLSTLWAQAQDHPLPILIGGVLTLLMLVWFGARRRSQRPGRLRGRVVENALTLAAAGVATGVAAVGMWRFFGDVLHIDSIVLRGALFAFLEIALFVSAIRARRNLLDDLDRITAARQAVQQDLADATDEAARATAELTLSRIMAERASTGVDGIAVWALAAMSGMFAALDARSFAESVFRLAAPLVAAWLWERGLAAHRRAHRGSRVINWKLTPERVLVKLGLAEPSGRGVGEVDAARRKARLARTAYQLHMLLAAKASPRRVRRAERALRRQVEQANEYIGLATDPAVRLDVQVHLATLYQAVAGTAPTAVAELTPWATSGPVSPPLGEVDLDTPAEGPAPAPMRPLVTVGEPETTAVPDRPATMPVLGGWPSRPGNRIGAMTAPQALAGPHATAMGAGTSVLAVDTRKRIQAEMPMKWNAFALLDDQVRQDDDRTPQQLAQLLVDGLGTQPGTAKRYEREWRALLAAGQRPHARARRLRVVPPRQNRSEPGRNPARQRRPHVEQRA